jgi:hypothetical protein
MRTFRVTEGGDERPFLEAGTPALRLSARRFLAADRRDRTPADLPEHLDAGALEGMGRVLLGAVAVLEHAGRPGGADQDWFLLLRQVSGRNALLLAGALSLLPTLLATRGRHGLGFRLIHAGLFAVLLYRQPVVAVFTFSVWNVLRAFPATPRRLVLGALPALALIAFGLLAYSRGVVAGLHLQVWEMVLVLVMIAASLAPGGAFRNAGRPRSRGRS